MAYNPDDPVMIPGSAGAPLGPGAMVANTLQGILAQRRSDERQAMLDELTRQNTQSEIQSRSDQANTNKMYRQAYADQRAQNVENSKRQAAEDQSMSDWGWNQWSDDPAIQSMYEAIGNNGALAKTLMPRILEQQMKGEQKTPPKSLVPAYRFDDVSKKTFPVMIDAPAPQTGQVPLMVPEGSPLQLQGISRTQETGPTPREGAGGTPTVSDKFTDVQGNPVIMSNKLDSKGNPVILHPNVDGSGWEPYIGKMIPVGAKPDTTWDIPNTELSNIQKLRGGSPQLKTKGAIPTPGAFWGTNAPNPQDLQRWQIAAKTAIANMRGVPANISSRFNKIIDDPDAEQFDSRSIAAKQSDLQPEEQAHLAKLLTDVRGK